VINEDKYLNIGIHNNNTNPIKNAIDGDFENFSKEENKK
jgi:hypothetical protein